MPYGNESPDVAASRSRAEPTAVFTGLADIVYQGSTPAEIYAAICIAATLMVPGCDHASVMLRDDHIATTAAASDSVARKIDKLEQALGEGPAWMPSRRKPHKSIPISAPAVSGPLWPPGSSPKHRCTESWAFACSSAPTKSAP